MPRASRRRDPRVAIHERACGHDAPESCATCAVEHAERAEVCAICADERQWVPATGQAWTTLEEMGAPAIPSNSRSSSPASTASRRRRRQGSASSPSSCRRPRATCCGTRSATATRRPSARSARSGTSSRSRPATRTCTASRSSGAERWRRPIYVSAADAHWVRAGPAMRCRPGSASCSPSRAHARPGRRTFPGSPSCTSLAATGEVRCSPATPCSSTSRSGMSVALCELPEPIPLSPAVVERLVTTLDAWPYDRLLHNFKDVIAADAKAVCVARPTGTEHGRRANTTTSPDNVAVAHPTGRANVNLSASGGLMRQPRSRRGGRADLRPRGSTRLAMPGVEPSGAGLSASLGMRTISRPRQYDAPPDRPEFHHAPVRCRAQRRSPCYRIVVKDQGSGQRFLSPSQA